MAPAKSTVQTSLKTQPLPLIAKELIHPALDQIPKVQLIQLTHSAGCDLQWTIKG
jgi:hypothetical protein